MKEEMQMNNQTDNPIQAHGRTGVCFFNSNRVWGGGEKWHHDMALKMKKHGYPVSVFTNAQSDLHQRLVNKGIPLFRMPLGNMSFLNPIKILRIRRIFKTTGVGTVFLNLSADLKTAGLAAKLAQVPRIIYRRGLANPVKDTPLNRFFYRRVITRLIVNSRATREAVLQNNPKLISPDRIQVIYNGIDLDKFDSLPLNSFLTGNSNAVIIGNSGRLVEQKGQHYLIELARCLKKADIPFNILIAGSGEREGELKQLAAASGVSDFVQFLGFVNDIKSFMHRIDIFVLTSLWEGFGYVIAEAMACRKPVVAFRISSNPELIEDGKSGFLVKPGDVDALCEKVSQLIHSPDLCRQMGEKGRAMVEERFEMPRIFSQVRSLIDP